MYINNNKKHLGGSNNMCDICVKKVTKLIKEIRDTK